MGNQTFRDKVQDKLAELKSLRDEIVVDLHLAGMDLRSEWKTLEKNLPDPSAAAEQIKGLTAEAVESVSEQLRNFRSRLSQRGSDTTVAQIMTTSVATCSPTDTLSVAVTTMFDRDVGCLPVVDAHNKVVGMVTDRDAAIAACTRGQRMEEISVQTVMSTNVIHCSPTDTAERALERMGKAQLNRLPVLTESNEVVGIVTLKDAAKVARQRKDGESTTGSADIVTTLTAIGKPSGPSN